MLTEACYSLLRAQLLESFFRSGGWSCSAIGARTVPRLAEVNVDLVVLIVTAIVAVGTRNFVWLDSSIRHCKPELTESAQRGRSLFNHRAERNQVRNSLVIAEIALALVLLVGAGLLLKATHGFRTSIQDSIVAMF